MFIEVKNAVKQYGKGDAAVHALDGASFSMEKGEIGVILGASGSLCQNLYQADSFQAV